MDTSIPLIPLKRCYACPEGQQWHPATTEYFHRDKGRKDGLGHRCKDCSKKHTQQHYREKPEYYQQYAKEHVEQTKRNVHNYKRSHTTQLRQYRKTHREHYNQASARWRKNHPDQSRMQTLKRTARKKSAPGTLTLRQIQEKLNAQHYRCYYAACGHAKFEKRNGRYVYHIEHTIPISRTEAGPRHDVNYVVLACPSCNLHKNNRLPHEWPEGGRLF